MSWFDAGLVDLAKKLPGAKVAVIGDLVCDHFIYGLTKRLSREAPIVILEHENEEFIPGGAANAINNLAELGARVFPIGMVGADAAGDQLLSIFSKKQLPSEGLVTDTARSTTVKKRVLGSGLHTTYQQVLRIDKGSRRAIEGDVEQKILDALEDVHKKADALVVSDYGYGVFSDRVVAKINALAKDQTLPVLVDSRYRICDFKAPTLITPNEPEAEQASGIRIRSDWDVTEAAQILKQQGQAKTVCITRGKKGMYIKQGETPGQMLPIFGSDQIADVTGAGDTVMAAFAASLVTGASLLEAAKIATVAGGLVVMKAGTATVTVDEIVAAITEHNGG